MTVTTSTNKTQPLGNGATTAFPYSFRIYSASDLVVTSTVIATGVDTELVLNTDYTVTGAASYNGGNVVFAVAPAAGVRLTIARVLTVTQGTDLRNQGAYFAETHEDVFDRHTMIDQQQQEQLDRSLTLSATSEGVSSELPSPEANNIIAWNDDGTALVNHGPVDNTILAAALIDESGSSLVGFIQSGTGAVATTAQAKMRQIVSAIDFGADPTGVLDSTAELQAAMDSLTGGGIVWLPPGTYKLSAVLQPIYGGITLRGNNKATTILSQTTLNTGIINDDGLSRTRIESMKLTYAGTALAGGVAINLTGMYSSADDFFIEGGYDAVDCTGANSIGLNDFQIHNAVNSSIKLTNTDNVNISNYYLTADDIVNYALNGHLNFNNCQGINSLMGEIYQGVTGARLISLRYSRFSLTYFDAAAQNVAITIGKINVFDNCWFSNGRSGGGNPGVAIGASGGTDTTDTTIFNGCTMANCGASGVLLWPGPIKTIFSACTINSNSATAGINSKHGIEVAANATDFIIENCTCSNVATLSGTQAYGIFINAGTSTDYSVLNNNLRLNGLGAMVDGVTTDLKRINGNVGYTNASSGAAAIAIGTSSVSFAHGLSVTPAREDVQITPTTNLSASGLATYWVSATSSTQITVSTNVVGVGAIWFFGWAVRAAGAQHY